MFRLFDVYFLTQFLQCVDKDNDLEMSFILYVKAVIKDVILVCAKLNIAITILNTFRITLRYLDCLKYLSLGLERCVSIVDPCQPFRDYCLQYRPQITMDTICWPLQQITSDSLL